MILRVRPSLLRRAARAVGMLALYAVAGAALAQTPVAGPGITGTLVRHAAFDASPLAPRTVDVWLPPSYGTCARCRYPVVYAADGQNLFDPATSFTGVDWGVDEALTDLAAVGAVREAIVVGVWNTPARRAEYWPGVVPILRPDDLGGRTVVSHHYLRFLTHTLKPFVDRTYRTRPGRAHTFVLGASSGGLFALYAASHNPDTFGGGAALSTHWPAVGTAFADWMAARLAALRPSVRPRLYTDRGTVALDSTYAAGHAYAAGALRRAGYRDGVTLVARTFAGADHSERAWRARVHLPLFFLLGAAQATR